eukprot:758323-Hanusia_phi.AAC.6
MKAGLLLQAEMKPSQQSREGGDSMEGDVRQGIQEGDEEDMMREEVPGKEQGRCLEGWRWSGTEGGEGGESEL